MALNSYLENKNLIKSLAIEKDLYNTIEKEILDYSELSPYCLLDWGHGKYGDFFTLELDRADSIRIDISISKNDLDLNIGESKTSLYQMDNLKSSKDLAKFKELLFQLLRSNVTERIYKTDDVDFIDRDTENTIFSQKGFFSFLFSKEIKDQLSFSPWVTQ